MCYFFYILAFWLYHGNTMVLDEVPNSAMYKRHGTYKTYTDDIPKSSVP